MKGQIIQKKTQYDEHQYLDVSENNGTPKIIPF